MAKAWNKSSKSLVFTGPTQLSKRKCAAVKYVLIALSVVMVMLVCLAAWRFAAIRSHGTAILIRKLPATGIHGWRHGVVQYKGERLSFFKLRSLAPGADAVFIRHAIQITGHRDITPAESDVLMSAKVLQFEHEGVKYEASMSTHSEMAFTAWVESAPDSRMSRLDPKDLLRKMNRDSSTK